MVCTVDHVGPCLDMAADGGWLNPLNWPYFIIEYINYIFN